MKHWTSIWSALGWGASRRVPGTQRLDPASGKLTSRTINADTAMQLSAVFACVRLLAETIACLPLRFYEIQPGGALKVINEHPLQNLLATKPNRYQTHIEFFETLVYQLSFHGNSYHHIERAKNEQIISLLPLMTPQVETILDKTGDLYHTYQNGQGVGAFAEETIWHNKLFGNGVIGMSPLNYARNSIGVAISAEDRINTMANNGFKPTGILMIDKILKKEQRDAIRANFADLVEGGDDALRILEAGMTYQPVSMNPKDMQFLESRRFQTEDIARFFGVPSILINDTSATTVWGSGIQQIIMGFWKLGLRPYCERISASMRIRLLKIEERRKILPMHDLDQLLRGDEKTRYEVYANAIKHHIRTPNECRHEEGLEPYTDGDKFPVITGSDKSDNGGKENV